MKYRKVVHLTYVLYSKLLEYSFFGMKLFVTRKFKLLYTDKINRSQS